MIWGWRFFGQYFWCFLGHPCCLPWKHLKRRHRTRWGAPLPRPDVSKWGGVLDSRSRGFWYLLQGLQGLHGEVGKTLPPMENEKFMGRCVFKWASRLVLPSFHYYVEGIRVFCVGKLWKKQSREHHLSYFIIVSSRWSETKKQIPLVSRVGVTKQVYDNIPAWKIHGLSFF